MVAAAANFVEAMESMTPLARSASLEDVANAVLFLASDEAGFLTGLDLPVDGGFTELGTYAPGQAAGDRQGQTLARRAAGVTRADVLAKIGLLQNKQARQSGRTSVPASLQGELQPTIYRFKLGGFEVATILDGKAIRDKLHPNFGGNATAEEVHALARANNIDTNRFEHPYIPTLVNTGKELVLFDTGNGALSREYEQLSKRLPPGNLVKELAKAGYKPEDVDVIVSTHGHPDHIGGLLEGGKPVFPNARYVFGAAEFDFWKRGENVREARKFNRELFVKICVPLADRSTFIKPGDQVVPGITALDAAGHSPGCWRFTSRARASVS